MPNQVTVSVTHVINNPLVVTSPAPPAGTQGVAYSHHILVTISAT